MDDIKPAVVSSKAIERIKKMREGGGKKPKAKAKIVGSVDAQERVLAKVIGKDIDSNGSKKLKGEDYDKESIEKVRDKDRKLIKAKGRPEDNLPREVYKDGKVNKPEQVILSIQEETFVNELVRGAIQPDAYLKAYPEKAKLKLSTIRSQASKLWREQRVQSRYNDIVEAHRMKERKETEWTRTSSREALVKVVERNNAELDRIDETYTRENQLTLEAITLCNAQMAEHKEGSEKWVQLSKHLLGLTKGMIKLDRERRVGKSHNDGIIDAVKEINRMYGYNEDNVDMVGVVVFSGDDELEE